MSFVFGQSVQGQSFNFNSQTDLNSFDPTITSISGDLILQSTSSTDPITDLSPLSNLVEVGSNLYIFNLDIPSLNGLQNLVSIGEILALQYNNELINLDELLNLSEVGEGISITDNSVLQSINGLQNIQLITEYIRISGNSSLTEISVFGNTTSLNGNLEISNNAVLTNISGFENLTYIGGDLTIEENSLNNLNGLSNLNFVNGNISISNENILENLNSLADLNYVAGNLSISHNENLVNLNGLNNLNKINGNLHIWWNSSLIELQSFNNLDTLEGYLSINYNNSLESVNGFSNLKYVEKSLYIEGNNNLSNLSGLLNLSSIGKNLEIAHNPILNSIEGFTNLNTIGGYFMLDNNGLIDINGFTSLTKIGVTINANLSISDNSSLLNIDGLSNLNSVSGNIFIVRNQNLTNIDGLFSLPSVLGSLIISENYELNSLNGLSNITGILNFLRISHNHSLMNVDGLDNLQTINGAMNIFGNNELTNLNGLENLTNVGSYLIISNNNNLVNCCGIHNLLTTPNAIGGNINIFNNPSNCSSETEIIEHCILQVFPNPPCINSENGSLQIQTFSNTPPYQYTWQNLTNGQTETGSANDNNFIIPNLAEGTYNLTVTDNDGNEFIEENLLLTSIPGSIFEIIEITTTNSSNGFSNGAIHLTVAGGFAPYTYQWSGMSTGNQSGVDSLNFSIQNQEAGEYEITVTDDNGGQQTVSLTLLDETVPTFPCTQPLDIVILNDVSGSVDGIEYAESKQFFVNFLEAANIGTGADESRAAIIEWSDATAQSVQIPMTDDLATLQGYVNNNRAFSGGTVPHSAMIFGENYLASLARPNVARVLILSTDGSGGQVSPSLIGLADQFKAQGYHIITVAFDNAFSDTYTRDILREVASIDLLAPGAPAYSQLDQNLADNIVNIYLCPIDPGSSATVYFERDGAIDILDIQANGGCPAPNFVDITFSIEALRELSIPSGMPVTFYYNNPAIFGATPILTWQVPCAIEAGTTDIFTVTLPVTAAANIFAVLNDDGNLPPPIALPLTDIDELAYSNNVADSTICTDPLPTLQTFKYTTTPTPICNHTVIYQVDVCNITSLDAAEVAIADDAPDGFILQDSLVNLNGCAAMNSGGFDIPAGCCVSVTYIYDASAAADGIYDNQDVDISGMTNQVYLDFDGYGTPAEDVLIDGTVDCPSTEINFTKSVNVTESCEDAFVVFTFSIDNQLNIPLNSLTFSDVLPAPVTWVFQPYNLNGLSISNANLNGNSATFLIDEITPNTVATFSMDASLNDWAASGILDNTATLEDVLDLENGGLQTLMSNTTSTVINAVPELQFDWTANCAEVNLTVQLLGETADFWQWQTLGDGIFNDSTSAAPIYVPGSEDLAATSFFLVATGQSNCGEINQTIEIIIDPPVPVPVELATCEGTTITYQNAILNIGDSQNFTLANELGCDSIVTVSVVALPNHATDFMVETCENTPVFYQNTELYAGDVQSFILQNSQGCDSVVTVSVNAFPMNEASLILETCEGNPIEYNNTFLEANDNATFTFADQNGCDSTVNITVNALPTSEEMLILETCENEAITFQNTTLNIGEEATFILENQEGCDSIIHVVVEATENEADFNVPNAFTPNGDGQNDCFGLVNLNDTDFDYFELKIFDRWGNRVFYTNDWDDCWNGEMNGQSASADVYFWRLEMETAACAIRVLEMGDLTLIR